MHKKQYALFFLGGEKFYKRGNLNTAIILLNKEENSIKEGKIHLNCSEKSQRSLQLQTYTGKNVHYMNRTTPPLVYTRLT